MKANHGLMCKAVQWHTYKVTFTNKTPNRNNQEGKKVDLIIKFLHIHFIDNKTQV